MCLRFVFLLITRAAAWLRLSRREDAWKTAEILILRHQLVVLQRQSAGRPKLAWADRPLLAALVGVIPRARRQGLRLLVTPDTILRWHRDIVRRRWATRSIRGRTGRPATRRTSRPWSSGSHARTPNGDIAGSTVNWPAGFQNSATGLDLCSYTARWYSLTRPPRTGRRMIRSWERFGDGVPPGLLSNLQRGHEPASPTGEADRAGSS